MRLLQKELGCDHFVPITVPLIRKNRHLPGKFDTRGTLSPPAVEERT